MTETIDLQWILVWVVTAIFCAAASGIAAQSKRMSGGAGALMGAVFGPLALLALAAMWPSGLPCRGCREPIHSMAKICPYCRTEMPHP